MKTKHGSPTPFEPRLVDGPTIPVLYPGERAIAHAVTRDGERLTVTAWLIEPAPGWIARLRRWRYRVFGELTAEIVVTKEGDS